MEIPFTCGGTVYSWSTHSHVEVLFTHAGHIHRWQSCSHMEDYSHVEDTFTGGGPVHMLGTFEVLLTYGGPIYKHGGRGPVAQSAACLTANQEVAGSCLSSAILSYM